MIHLSTIMRRFFAGLTILSVTFTQACPAWAAWNRKMEERVSVTQEAKLSGQSDFFQNDLSEDCSITAEPFERAEDFNACQLSFGVVVGSKPFGQVLGRYGRFVEPDVQGVDLRIVSDSHVGISLPIVYINGDHNNPIFFFDENRANDLARITLSVPLGVEGEGQPAFQPSQFGRPDGLLYLLRGSSSEANLFPGVFTPLNWQRA